MNNLDLTYFYDLYIQENELNTDDDFNDFQECIINEGFAICKIINFSRDLIFYSNDTIINDENVRYLVYFHKVKGRYEPKIGDIKNAVKEIKKSLMDKKK